jgi:hypothetical protein
MKEMYHFFVLLIIEISIKKTNRVGTGGGNVSAFKRQFLCNRIGKVSGFF